jgi:hypothetical protein
MSRRNLPRPVPIAVSAIAIAIALSNAAPAALKNIVYTKPANWGVGQGGQGWPVRNGVIDFSGATYFNTFTPGNVDFWNGQSNHRIGGSNEGDYFGHLFLGCINITVPGAYGFGTISDDGSQVWIDGKLVVDNREVQWFDWEDNVSEDVAPGASPLVLEAGMHAIEVRFYEQTVWSGIRLYWLKPGSGNSIIPYSGTTFHDPDPTKRPTFNPNTNWEVVPASVLSTSMPAPLADFDSNGLVGGEDLARWKSGIGLTGPQADYAHGDADGDHDVDGADFLRWQRDLGKQSPAPAVVPEPASTTLATFAIALFGSWARLRRRRTLRRVWGDWHLCERRDFGRKERGHEGIPR